MKTIVYTAAVAVLCGLSVRADESMSTTTTLSKYDSSGISENYAGRLGAGVMFGEPVGGTLKYWLTDQFALDAAAGWSPRSDSYLYLHSDVLWHNFNLIPVQEGRLPVYIGVGGFARFRNHDRDDQAGIRLPIGISYMFKEVPVDIFAEIAPAIDLTPSVRGDFTGGFGIRYWF